MAYCYSEKTEAARLAVQVARRDSIIAAAIDAIKKYGIEIGIREVAERGKFSIGLIYKEFPDVPELKAAAFAQLMERDVTELRLAAAREKNALQGLASALAALYGQWDNVKLVHAMMGSPVYRNAVRQELEHLLKSAAPNLSVRERANAAAAALGSLYGLHDSDSGAARTRASAAVLFALRGIGLSDAAARRAFA